jgi:FKBP-type peptidyl-prolyl cis-trans isomerase
MKTLDTKEWVAVVVAIFVVGFFFIYGQTVISFFNSANQQAQIKQGPQILIEDTKPGTGDVATVGTRVVIHYVGHLIDGQVFDSSVARNEPLQFVIGEGKIKGGLETGVAGMRVGGTRIISVPPELGFGSNDYGPIPGNSTLIYEIALLKVDLP